VTPSRVFLDTFFVIALLNKRDAYHDSAKSWLPVLQSVKEIWTTEVVLIEICDGLSSLNRIAAASFIHQLKRTSNINIAPASTSLINHGLTMYEERGDKVWGLTDCISFVVMNDNHLTEALTADEHFSQAGFKALLL